MAAVLLQQTGMQMYELQEQRIRHTPDLAEERIAPEK